MKTLFKAIVVLLHALFIVVGIYALLALFEQVPSFKFLFSKDVYAYETFTKSILFIFLPIGIILFFSQLIVDDNTPCKVLTLIGLGLLVVPSLIFHIQLMQANGAGEFPEHFDKGYYGLLMIFPIISLYLTVSFQLTGKDQFVIHGDYDDALDNWGCILPYVYICGGGALIMFFIGTFAGVGFFSVLTLIVGLISLAVMGISRLKNGSPFEY